MTVAEIKAMLPGEFQPWADQYGPYLGAWAAQDLAAWIALLKAGDEAAAEAKFNCGMSETDKLAREQELLGQAKAAQKSESDRRQIARSAVIAAISIGIGLL